jgi:hypothetical protein
MNTYINTLTNSRGDVLPGDRLQVVTSAGASVPIYADNGGTPFTDESGGAVSYATADLNGLVQFYWEPQEGQVLQQLDPSGNLRRAITDFAKPFLLGAFGGAIAQSQVTDLESDLAAKASVDDLASKASTADLSSTDPGKGADLLGTSRPVGTGNMGALVSGLPINLAEFTSGVGTGNATADTDAFLAAAAALQSGAIAALQLPAATLLLEDAVDINAPASRVAILGHGREATRILVSVDDSVPGGKRQHPWVIRNTTNGVLIQGVTMEVDAPDPAYYQNAWEFMNVSNLLIDDFAVINSDQYGIGIYDDVRAAPGTRTAKACDNIVIRNGVIIGASQYGIQHFPKVLSDGLLISGVQCFDCGRDVQGLGNFEPAAIKAGQTTRRTILDQIDIVCAPTAVGLAIANYEDFSASRIRIRNAKRQAVSFSAGTHPNLITRYPLTPGGPAPAPYLPTHARIDLEVEVFHSVAEAGKRERPFITGQIGANAEVSCVTAATSSITLSGEQTIAGVAVTAGQRVLLTGQTDPSQNGIWVAAGGAWSRAADFDATAEVTNNSVVNVTGGSNFGGWILISADPHTVGTTPQIWSAFNPGPIRIAARLDGEVIESGAYGGFNGAVHVNFGVDMPGLDFDVKYTGGNPAGLSGSPALPPATVYLTNDSGGAAVNPNIRIEADNPHRHAQQTYMALWLKGQKGAVASVRGRNFGNYVFRGQDNVGVVRLALDIEDYNLTNDVAQAPINISGSTGEYRVERPVYRQNGGVGHGAYWVLGGGTAPVHLIEPRSVGATLTVSVDPLVVFQSPGRRGAATLATGAASVSFGGLSEPDANYDVLLETGVAESLSVTGKSATGFSITSSNGASTAVVNWRLVR